MTDLIKNNNFAKINKLFETDKMDALLEEASARLGRQDGFTTKKSFSPSSFYDKGNGVCLTGDAEFVTDEGIKTLKEMNGKNVVVWSGGTRMKTPQHAFDSRGEWQQATVEYFGKHPTFEITLKRHGVLRKIRATEQHRWIIQSAKFTTTQQRAVPKVVNTTELIPGNILWHSQHRNNLANTNISQDGIRAGVVYGDGSCDLGYRQRKNGSYVTLHGDKDFELLKYFDGYSVSEQFAHHGEGSEYMVDNHVMCRKVYGLPRHYKATPDLTESASYLYGWLAGYFAADGNIHDSGSASITSHSKESILAVRDVCAILGINTGSVCNSVRNKLGKDYNQWSISINSRDLPIDFFLLNHHKEYWMLLDKPQRRSYSRWSVVSVQSTNEIEDVYCVVQPETERFALADGILTMNCPRYWYFAFHGAEFKYENTARQRANMDAGTDAGERIAKLFKEAGILKSAESKVIYNDPPIFGYMDLAVEWQGEEMIGEVKTTRTESFNTRKAAMAAPGYQLVQLLIYMYVYGKKKGFFVVEDKNDHSLLILPVLMTDERKTMIEGIFDWMRTVKAHSDEDKMPTRPFTKSSTHCKSCPVRDACWDGFIKQTKTREGQDPNPGVVDLPPLVVPQ